MSRHEPRPIGLPDELWERADVLGACRARDANALLRFARRHGVTNDRLAHWTGIDPGEISKRLSGKTTSPVRTLDRWERIATGLGMPDVARLAVGLAPTRPCSCGAGRGRGRRPGSCRRGTMDG